MTNRNHWSEGGKQLGSAVIAALVKYGAPEDKNLVAVRRVITGANGRSFFEFCRECMKLNDPFIRENLARYAAKGAEENRELNGFINSAITQTAWIGDQAIAESLKGGKNEIDFAVLKRKPGTVISVCLPLTELGVASRWLRVVCSTMLTDTLKEGARGSRTKVLAVLDEIFQIGHLKVLSDAWSMASGASELLLFPVYQLMGQMRAQFKDVPETVLANSSTQIFFGIRDLATAEYISKKAGTTTIVVPSRSFSIDPKTGEPVVNIGATTAARPLLHPDEIMFGLKNNEMLLFADGLPGVCRAKRKPYFKCLDLIGKFRENPYFPKGGSAMRLIRWLYSWLYR